MWRIARGGSAIRRAVNAQPPPCRCGTDGSPRRVWRLLRGPRRRPRKPISSATAPVSGEYPSVIAGPGSDGGRPGTRHHRPPRQTRRVQKPDHAAEDHELVAQDEDLHVISLDSRTANRTLVGCRSPRSTSTTSRSWQRFGAVKPTPAWVASLST